MRRYDSVVDSYNAMMENPDGEFIKFDDIKTREDVVTFVGKQFLNHKTKGIDTKREKAGRVHYGKQELRDLLDFIYCEEPGEGEELNCETYGDGNRPWE